MTTLTEYVAEMTSRSTVAQPVRRLSAPAVINKGANYLLIYRDPVTGHLTSNADNRDGILAVIDGLVMRGEPFAVDRRRTMDDVLGLIPRTASYATLKTGGQVGRVNALNALSRIPGNSQIVVVSEALSRAYWIPGESAAARESFIRQAFGDLAGQLAALDGRATKTQASYGGHLSSAVGKVNDHTATQYRSATRAGELWKAYAAADVVGHREQLLTGDATLVEPLAVRGTTVVAAIMNGSRLKPNKRVAVFDRGMDKIGDAQTGEFGYDPDRDTVTAEITTAGQAVSSLGFRKMHRMAGTGETFILADIPFTREKIGGYGHWAAPSRMAKVQRDVPFAIALAGAKVR